MKTLTLTCLVILFIVMIVSCKKNSDAPVANADLTAKWSLIKAVYIDLSTNISSTQSYDAGSYLDFNSNGICYSFVDGDMYSSNWNYIDNNTGIFIDNSSGFDVNDSGYTITKLTPDSLQLYSKELIDGDNQTLYLSK